MTYTSAPLPNALQTSHLLPLRWLRLPLLIATVGLSCVCIAVGAQALNKGAMLEKELTAFAQSSHSSIVYDMNDIKATSIVLTLVASLIALASMVFSIVLIFDWIAHLGRPPPTSKGHKSFADDDNVGATPAPPLITRLPLSTRTLGYQTLILSFLSIWILAVLIPSTIFARTGSAHVTVQGELAGFSPDPRYWDYGFFRCLAAAPWFTLIFSVPTIAVSWIARNYYLDIPGGRK